MRSVVVVTGGPASGKTTAVRHLARRLAAAGLRVGGVVQPALQVAGARVGYELLDVATGDRVSLARRTAVPQAHGCGFAFDPAAWPWAAARLRRARLEDDVVVADELGRLEATGAGHLPALLDPPDPGCARLWLLGVRADRLSALARWLGPCARIVAAAADLDVVEHELRDLVRQNPSFARR